jgi:hypothetical protein
MTIRKLERVIPSIPASDGAGVKLRRSLGSSQLARHDPFLMLDEFFSDDPTITSPAFPRIRTAASRPSPTCSMATCSTRTTTATPATSAPATCSG